MSMIVSVNWSANMVDFHLKLVVQQFAVFLELVAFAASFAVFLELVVFAASFAVILVETLAVTLDVQMYL